MLEVKRVLDGAMIIKLEIESVMMNAVRWWWDYIKTLSPFLFAMVMESLME